VLRQFGIGEEFRIRLGDPRQCKQYLSQVPAHGLGGGRQEVPAE
jgi:hypothetical protein